MIQTIKLKADEFFTFPEKIQPLPYFLIGGRGTGKSYAVKHYVKDLLLKSNYARKYMYVRIQRNELATHDSWLAESGLLETLPEDVESAKIIRGKPYAGAVTLQVKYPIAGVQNRHIGYVSSLETSALIKSADYSDVDCIIFEEFIRRGFSTKAIEDYCFNFSELMETVVRERHIPMFFIANMLNAYNPLAQLFKESITYKIFSENRRENIKDTKFAQYLQGEMYSTDTYNIEDFEYMCTLKMSDGNFLSLYCDKFFNKDILITSKKQTKQQRDDLLFLLRPAFLYGFDRIKFYFDRDKTEMYFYENIMPIRMKIRNKIKSIVA